MKNLVLQIAVITFITFPVAAQDMFPVRQLTFGPAQQGFAEWSTDSKYIVYQYTDMHDTLGKNGLWRVSADGTGAEQLFRGLAGHPKCPPDVKETAFNKKMAGNHDFLITDTDINKVKNEHMIIR